MRGLMEEVDRELGLPCFMPANHERLMIPVPMSIPMSISYPLLAEHSARFHSNFADQLFSTPASSYFTAHMTTCDIQPCQPLALSCDLDLTSAQVRSVLGDIPAEITELPDNKTRLTWSEGQDEAVTSVLAAVPEPPALP